MLRTRTVVGLSFVVLLPGLLAPRRPATPPIDDAAAPSADAVGMPLPTTPGPHADTLPVPTDPHALRAWLGSGTYKSWPHQSGPKAAESPHDDQAQVFLNPSLRESVKARKPVHHQGAAAVLEMSDENGLAWGWAVAVKAQASSNHGNGWYWYQVKSTPESGRTDFGGHMIPSETDDAGLGLRTCLTCHVKGHDYIITRSLD